MQTYDFAPSRIFSALASAAFALMVPLEAYGQAPRLIGGPGVPLMVNDAAAASISVQGKARPLKVVTVVDAPQRLTGKSDPQWFWLTGSPVAREWAEREKPEPSLGSFDVRWSEPLTKAEFDSISLLSSDGKTLERATQGVGGAVWLDATAAGWEHLSRAAISVIAAVPIDQREAAFAALETATHTPGDHWRAALLRRAIKPSTPARPDFQPPALNTLALQLGDQWAGAVGRLSRVDFALGQQLARRLLLIAQLPTSESSGEWAVVWADADPHTLDTLLTTPPSGLPTAATSFLAPLPASFAWVRDDAGLRNPFSDHAISTLGLVSLSEQPLLATFATLAQRSGAGNGEPVAVQPLIGQSIALTPSSADQTGISASRGSTTGLSINFKLGATPVSLPVAAAAIHAAPPGVLIGPFALDWTLDSFRRQQAVRVGGVAASLLPDPATPGRWSLYLESRHLAGVRDADLDRERFRVWVGPTGSPIARIEVSPTGAAESGGSTTRISRIPGGWCATITLPADSVDASGILRLGVDHTQPSGIRSCWPRPMLPWQDEPGRLAINAGAWDRELKP